MYMRYEAEFIRRFDRHSINHVIWAALKIIGADEVGDYGPLKMSQKIDAMTFWAEAAKFNDSDLRFLIDYVSLAQAHVRLSGLGFIELIQNDTK